MQWLQRYRGGMFVMRCSTDQCDTIWSHMKPCPHCQDVLCNTIYNSAPVPISWPISSAPILSTGYRGNSAKHTLSRLNFYCTLLLWYSTVFFCTLLFCTLYYNILCSVLHCVLLYYTVLYVAEWVTLAHFTSWWNTRNCWKMAPNWVWGVFNRPGP